ncbi:hypothetical protein B0H21DRAFT_699044 [Amylocystis lapponica]|nr:hypothetical protein B0H21DRAFT_699044 [Amylocystis lapponica]
MPAHRGPYNLPPADRDVDDLTYNPQADARPDNAAFDPDTTDPRSHPIGARGANNQPTSVDAGREDRQAAQSERTGRIPRGEANDLMDNMSDEERNVGQGRTRGNKVDAYKQERGIDNALEQSGISSADQDVEIGAATGY